MRLRIHLRLCIGFFVSLVTLSTGQPAPSQVSANTPAAPAAKVIVDDAVLIPMPKLDDSQLREVIQDVVSQYRLTANFLPVPLSALLIEAPSGVTLVAAIRKGENAAAETVVMGYATPARRLPQLWVAAWRGEIKSRAPWSPLMQGAQGEFGRAVQALLAERSRIRSKLSLADLESRVLNLSYVDADAALFALRAMGYGAITDSEPLAADDSYRGEETFSAAAAGQSSTGFPGNSAPNSGQSGFGGSSGGGFGGGNSGFGGSGGGFGGGGFGGAGAQPGGPKFAAVKNLPSSVNFDRLPLVVRMPATEARNMGLVGSDVGMPGQSQSQGSQRDSLGLTIVPQAATNLTETISGGTAQLLVMFHPDYPEQLQRIRRVLQDTIDRPARQVFVEGLVLEVSSEALSDLGVKWDLKKGTQSFSLGTLTNPGAGDTALSFLRDGAVNITPSQMMARINALVQTNKAEILSRPSVLTLDNRQATIRVGTDIPIATSKDASSGTTGRVSFSFQYLPTGIMMNVRPRVSEDGQEISMLIDATVSATVPNQDLRLLDPGTRVTLASAPTISTRRVQTYARIRDNQPLIIGGLVSRDQISGKDKVPLAGEIPFLGKLFGYENKQDRKREVIIVLTPSVVTENIRETKSVSPRDDDIFDLRDTTLFKEHYRLRAEDLVDSSYIRFNRRFLNYRDIANRIVEREPSAASRAAIAPFVGTRIPGEFIFVSNMMYRLMDRLKADEPIKIENIQTFERGANGEQRPIAVVDLLARYGGGSSYKEFFSNNKGKALALTYRLTRNSSRPEDMFGEPVPTIALVDCPDRATWRRLLWDLNQTTGPIPQFTILIHERDDLRRLQLAYATQNTILNNGGTASMLFDRFLPGRMLHLQEVSPNWERVLLPPIAQYFFIGEHGTMYFQREHERAIQTLDSALRQKENAALVEGLVLP
jgi:general secretion pathway protein D